MVNLTELGKQEVNIYIREAEAKRKEILDAKLDTTDDTLLPEEEDILMDIEHFETEGEYCNGWSVTDHFNTDYPLYLKRGIHYC